MYHRARRQGLVRRMPFGKILQDPFKTKDHEGGIACLGFIFTGAVIDLVGVLLSWPDALGSSVILS